MQDSGLDKLPSFPVDEFFIISGTTIPIWWSDCTQLIVIDWNWILVSSKFLQWCHRVVESSQQWAADIFKLTPVGAETNLSDPFMDLNLFLDSGVDPCSDRMNASCAEQIKLKTSQSHVALSAFPVGLISIDLKWLQLSHMCGKFTVPNWHLLL